jgi:TRAP-type C4-dicarboxylate transport system permease small subunit
MMKRLLQFDEALFRVERMVVAAMLGSMGLVVFLDVLHRVSTRGGSLLANPLVTGGVTALLGVFAMRTRGDSSGTGVAKGLGIGVGFAAAQVGFVQLVPNGLVWSQTLALALTLWLGLIGASLAAHDHRHLALDVGSKLWPPHIAPKVAALGHIVTAAFCVLVLVLGYRSTSQHIDLWEQTAHAGGTLSGTAIPKWFAAAAIPYGMLALSFRFTLEAIRTWTGDLPIGGDDTLRQLGIEEAQ